MTDHPRLWWHSRLFESIALWLDRYSDQFVAVLLHRITRGLFAWMVFTILASIVLFQAWNAFNVAERHDGNSGHCTIDFGGQWLMGAMLVTGNGRELYNRNFQREVLYNAYPWGQQEPTATRSDAENLMTWVMGRDNQQAADTMGTMVAPLAFPDALGTVLAIESVRPQWSEASLSEATLRRVGGPLYPPINCFVHAPLALFQPDVAYRINQVLQLVWALIAAFGVRYMTGGRIWVAVAASLILLYPGFKGAIHLGQNPPLTLAIITWGWALIARDRPTAGGIIWGLLAFKPVWAAAFFLVPMITFRWRVCVAMVATGAFLGLLTLPFVGLHSWFDWLAVGRDAAELYKTDYNWVFLSRDILGIPRRWLLDFNKPTAERDVPLATHIGWGIFYICLIFTIAVALLRRGRCRESTGLASGFLLLGAWLSCFHFMYYDILLTVFPFFVLLADPPSYLRPTLFALVPLAKNALDPDFTHFYRPWISDSTPPPAPWLRSNYRNVWVLNRLVPNVLFMLILIEHFVPRIGLAGTVTFTYGPLPMQASTMHDEEGQVLLYRKVRDVANMRVTTALYDDGQPWDTYAIMALWFWCGLSLLIWRGPSVKNLPKPIVDDGTPITSIISSPANA